MRSAFISVVLAIVSVGLFLGSISIGHETAATTKDAKADTIQLSASKLSATVLVTDTLKGEDVDAESLHTHSGDAEIHSQQGRESHRSQWLRPSLAVAGCVVAFLAFVFIVPTGGLFSGTPLDWFLHDPNENPQSRIDFYSRNPRTQWFLATGAVFLFVNLITQTIVNGLCQIGFGAEFRSDSFVATALILVVGLLTVIWAFPAMFTLTSLTGSLRHESRFHRVKSKKAAASVAEALRNKLLPTQNDLIDRFFSVLTKNGDRPNQITLTGGWGSGKSTVVNNLDWAQFLPRHANQKDGRKRPARFVFAHINVWHYSDPFSFEDRLMHDIFINPEVMRLGGWTIYAPTRPGLRLFLWIVELWSKRRILGRSNNKRGELGVADVFAPAEVRYSERFERLAKRIQQAGSTLVVVVDEIDRSPSDIAQVALTVINRSMNNKESTIVTVSNHNHLLRKAFDPSKVQTADLRSTVFSDLEQTLEEIVHKDGELPKDRNEYLGAALNKQKTPVEGATESTALPKIPSDISPEEQATYLARFVIESNLIAGFYNLPLSERKKFTNRSYRRYAPQTRFQMTPGSEDYAQFLPRVIDYTLIPAEYRNLTTADDWEETLANEELADFLAANHDTISLRTVESDLTMVLSSLRSRYVRDALDMGPRLDSDAQNLIFSATILGMFKAALEEHVG